MAISATHYGILKEMHARGVLPQHGDILEIGRANWYGDLPVEKLSTELGRDLSGLDSFAVVMEVYGALFGTRAVDAIDGDANAPNAINHDLNEPLDLGCLYNVVYNHGTAEHVGNIGQVFKTMHDHCRVGGLLINEGPMTGWRNHSLYALRPAFWFGLPRANDYEVLGVWTQHFNSQTLIQLDSEEHANLLDHAGQLPPSGMALAVYRKTKEAPFKHATQSVYDGTATPFVAQRWSHPTAR